MQRRDHLAVFSRHAAAEQDRKILLSRIGYFYYRRAERFLPVFVVSLFEMIVIHERRFHRELGHELRFQKSRNIDRFWRVFAEIRRRLSVVQSGGDNFGRHELFRIDRV